MGDGWSDWKYGPYGGTGSYTGYGTTSGSSVIYGTDSITTGTSSTSGDYTIWTDGSLYYTSPEDVTEYVVEEGVIKYKDPKTYEWRELGDLELESDPFPIEMEKKEAKPKQSRKAKIKLNKKLGVDMEEIAEELF
jgi:hypothetical protein